MGNAIERLGDHGLVPNWIVFEHQQRYAFAANYVKDQVVVDCACGTGIGAHLFAAAGAKMVTGIDRSEAALASARQNGERDNLEFRLGDTTVLPVSDRYADLYVSLETIEHVDDDIALLDEARRILKPTGRLIVSTPNRTLVNPGKSIDQKPWNRHHVREYSQQEFSDLLASAFEGVELYGQNLARRGSTAALSILGKVLPRYGAVRLRQIMKLPRLLYDKLENHGVIRIGPGQVFECLIAVCSGPKPLATPG